MERTIEKQIELNGRTFVIKKFDARTGSRILFKVIGVLKSVFTGFDPSIVKSAEDMSKMDMSGILAAITDIPDDDFTMIQNACLKVCYEQLPAGLTPVLDRNNNFAVVGLDQDTTTVLALTIQALTFNVADFFSESSMSLLMPK